MHSYLKNLRYNLKTNISFKYLSQSGLYVNLMPNSTNIHYTVQSTIFYLENVKFLI